MAVKTSGGFDFGNDVEFEQDNFGGIGLYIDGVKVNGVREFHMSNCVGDVPEITITFIPRTVNKRIDDK